MCAAVTIIVLTILGVDPLPALVEIPLDGREAAEAVPQLLAELNDVTNGSDRRQQVAYLLARIDTEANVAVADLIAIVRNEPEQRRWALKALALFGRTASDAVPQMIAIASDDSQSLDLRSLAVETMAVNADQHPEVLQWFHRTLRAGSPDRASERRFVSLARLLGPTGEVITPTLLKKLASDDVEIQRLAAVSLGAIGSPLAKERLMIATLNSDEPVVAEAAAAALNQIAGPVADAFGQILAVADPDARRRVATYWTRPSAERSLAFRSLLRDESRGVRLEAAKTMIRETRSEAIAVFEELAMGTDYVAREARKALHVIDVGRVSPTFGRGP